MRIDLREYTSRERPDLVDTEVEKADFEDYRLLCDGETDGFRRIGILTAEAYEEALLDPKTIFSQIDDKKFPAITPIGYEERYDDDRCREMTGTDDALLLTLPLSQAYAGAFEPERLSGGEALASDFSILVEQIVPPEGVSDRQGNHEHVASLLNASLGRLSVNEFLHPRLEHKENNRTAWMGVFSFDVDAIPQTESYNGLTPGQAIEKAWGEHCNENGKEAIPGKEAEGTFLFTAAQLREHPEIVDALWGISEVGFGKVLGAFHPISMEVTRAFFDQQILTDGMYTSVRYHQGKPVCFGTLAPSMDHNDWLDCDSTVLAEDLEHAREKGQSLIHFFELISNGPAGMRFSPDVIGLFADLVGRTGRSYHVIFESTNLSATYIPRIIARQLSQTASVRLTKEPKMLERLDYWYLRS